MNVSLTPELAGFIEERVTSGKYQTSSEVVREALRLLEEKERDREAAFQELKAKLRHASDQADRGEFVDPDAVLRKIAALKRNRAAGRK
jgi:antitoxin ParD1/3/4